MATERRIWIDGKEWLFSGDHITGGSIASMTNSNDRKIYLKNNEFPDAWFRNWEVYPANAARAIAITAGRMEFYTVPPATTYR